MSANRAWLRIARRELAGGLAGFWIYMACLTLGAWAIAAAGSITASFGRGLDIQSQQLLGGDAAISISQREATAEERVWMADRGTMTEAAQVDLMARNGDAVRQIDVRGIDEKFPLIGKFEFNPDAPPQADILARKDGVWGIAASESLLTNLNVKLGDRLTLGDFEVELRALLLREPDRIGVPGAFEPRVVISIEALRETGQLAPGRLFRTAYRILLKPEYRETFEKDVTDTWGESGLRYRSPDDAVDGLRMLLDMLNTFMSVIGIAALVAGGVGVSQATSSFLESRIDSIAVLKALGADAGTIRAAYAAQLGVLAGLGAFVGVVLGAASPWLLKTLTGNIIPLPTDLSLYPWPLLKAFVLAMLAAVMFAAIPLGRARATPPAALFRREGGEALGKSPALERGIAAAAGLALVIVSTTGSVEPLMTLGLLAGAGVAYLILVGAAFVVKLLARMASKRARGYLRLALANLGGPGSLAPVVAPALGLGLALMTLVAVVQTNLLSQLRDTAPANAPSIIFRQIPHEDIAQFDALMSQYGVDLKQSKTYQRAPLILGRVTTLKGEPLDENKVSPEERWVTRGETAMTVLGAKPPEVNVRQGKWWPADYSGPLLVSVEEGAATGLKLRIGDKVGFLVFGREIEGEVASIRKVDWGGFGPNMAFILSPGTLEAARPFHTAIVIVPPDKEPEVIRAVADRWPGVLAFQLRATLETAADLFAQVSLAVSALAGVVTTAGVLVLFGAFAAAARRRRRESALLKVFGGSRPAILGLYAFEFALAAFAASTLGAIMGIAAAHPIVILVFEAQWRFDFLPVLMVAGIAIVAAATGGALVGWATLSHRPALVLRSA
ncbi:MAG: FtsX-like permease family protein [Hyphomonadaceae bacterium]|nr:FtsX-like permease family protein [Hyphomonadaceae bacterium]